MEDAITSESKCPECGRPFLPGEDSCPNCTPTRVRRPSRDDDDDDDDWDRPARRRPREEPLEATDLFVPTNVSPWAVASCYLGLIGFCLPVVGLIFSIPALIFGIIAMRKRSKAQTYGAVTSNIRAIIGLVLSSLSILSSVALLILLAFKK